MLVGTIQDKMKGYTYKVIAMDISSVFAGVLQSGSYDAMQYLTKEEDFDFTWERGFEIGLSNVKVESSHKVDEKGKRKKENINTEFYCRLGAFIRYAKRSCSLEHLEGYIGLKHLEYTPEAENKYKLPFGRVVLKLGEIYSLHIENMYFKIDIDMDILEERILKEMKFAVKEGIAFNKEYLGFEVEENKYVGEKEHLGGISQFYTELDDIRRNNPQKNYDWLLANQYEIVTDETLEAIYNRILNHNGYVFYDTETTGLNITFKSRLGVDYGDQLVGVVLTIEDGVSYFFPTQMKSIPNLCGGDHYYFMERYMRPILEGKELVAFNMAFDWKVAYIYGINANIKHDVMAIYNLTLGAEKINFPKDLKGITSTILLRDSLSLSDLVRGNEWGEVDVKFWDLPKEMVRLYACADTDNTKGLFDYAEKNNLLQRYNATRVYLIEVSFSYVVAYQEFYGHKIDIENLNILHKSIDKDLEYNMQKMKEIVGYEFNPNSPPQLVRIMYEELKIPKQYSRKTGNLTTDKETLKYLANLKDVNGEVKYPFVKYLIDYRKAEGVRKIIDNFPTLATTDGYLFSRVMQYGTTTGRVSINTPNYQSYNDTVKKHIIPRDGFIMFDTDYSSVEYRVLGSIAGNEGIKEGFKNPYFDYHSYQASRMYNIPYASVTKQIRQTAKSINFGLPYGMGHERLGMEVFGEQSDENTAKAKALEEKYFKGQEDIKHFFEYHRNKGVNLGYTETFFGRRRYYNKAKFSERAIRRQAGNQVIQGCLHGDTRVQTQDFGIVKIKDIVGYKLNVWDGNSWTKGDITYSGKKRKCIVRFKGGKEIICSPIHKFLVRSHRGNERFVECKDLLTLENTKNAHRVVVNPSVIYDYGMEYHSKTLSNEIKDLDIRHRIPDELFCKPYLLRGFLQDVFDRDGGITGKMITLVQGVQDDFVPFLKDIQTALLFFGVRSRIRCYKDRVVLQIKTTDNDIFMEHIGFINKEKQEKGEKLTCIEDEHIYGKCLIVESVEITDEYIDMYDVCNTERGYYVADGVITHNTAADIYKLAVSRVFKRICREGWLGKVMFTGFIHDELLGEIHTSIDPMKFLKVLREEFEVKIRDEKGVDWCPLYMGFGFGNCWYDAKKIELPIRMQWELVDRYGESGYPDWDGDVDKFCKGIPDMIRDFQIREMWYMLTLEENQGVQIDPEINNILLGVCKEDNVLIEKGYCEFFGKEKLVDSEVSETIRGRELEFVEYLKKEYNIEGLYKNKDGEIELRIPKIEDTQQAIEIYCMLHNKDRSKINVLNIDTSASEKDIEENFNDIKDNDYDFSYNESDEVAKERAMLRRVNNLGLFLDLEEKHIYLSLEQKSILNLVNQLSNREQKGYRVYFIEQKEKGYNKYQTEVYISSEKVQYIQQAYLMYKK